MEPQSTENQAKVRGFFLSTYTDFVKKEKGPAGLVKLQKLVPEVDIYHISPLRKYHLQNEIALLRAAAIVVYGDDSPESWKKMGYLDFVAIQQSSLGKILLLLCGQNLEALIKKGGKRLFDLFAPFITFSYSDLSNHGATFKMENDPYPKEYFLGFFNRLLIDHLKCPGEITVFDEGNGTHIYKLSVTPKNK